MSRFSKHNPGFSVFEPTEFGNVDYLLTLKGQAAYQEDLGEALSQIGAPSVQPNINLD